MRLGDLDADVSTDLVPADDRAAVAAVRADPTLVRPLVVRRLRAPVALFEELLEDLPGTARIVAGLGLGRYRIERRPDGTIHIDDRHGARARVARLVHLPGTRLYRAYGEIGVFPLPAVHGTGVIALRFEPEEGGLALRTGGQIFFRLESEFLHRLARPVIALLRAAIDAKVRALIGATIAACELVAARRRAAEERGQIRSGGNRSG